MITIKSVRNVKREGRRITTNGFTPGLVRELIKNKETLVAVYRSGFFEHIAEVVPDRATYEGIKGRTAFGAIKGLKFYAFKLGVEPCRNAGVEAFMADPARSVA